MQIQTKIESGGIVQTREPNDIVGIELSGHPQMDVQRPIKRIFYSSLDPDSLHDGGSALYLSV